MKNYKLCLYYSPTCYVSLIDKDFKAFKDIDSYTLAFKDENELRSSTNQNIRDKIYNFMEQKYRYIDKIKDKNARNGKIVIIENSSDNVTYIKPLYQCSKKNTDCLKIINSIIKKLRDANDIKLLTNLLNKFNDIFMTKYNIYTNKLPKLKKDINYNKHTNPTTPREIEEYSKILKIIRETLKHGYNKTTLSMPDNKEYNIRMINDYLDYKLSTVSKKTSSLNEKSDISTDNEKEENIHDKFIQEVLESAYKKGKEAALFEFMDDYYLNIIDKFSNQDDTKVKKMK